MRALVELFFLELLLAFLNQGINNLIKKAKHWYCVWETPAEDAHK